MEKIADNHVFPLAHISFWHYIIIYSSNIDSASQDVIAKIFNGFLN